MSYAITYPLDEERNYIFPEEEIEIIGGGSRLVPQVVGTGSRMYSKLDENKGLVAIDSSGNGLHGAFQGGYTENQWVPGKINSAIEGLSVTNGFINYDQLIEYERTQSFSLELWVKFTSTTTQSFVSKQKDSGSFEGFAINVLSGKIRFTIRDDLGNVLSIETNSVYNDGNWHHIVCTYDGSSIISGMTTYIDNVIDQVSIIADTLSGTIKNSADFQVSGRDGNNLCIESTTVIDEIVVYDRELSSAEVAFRWNGGAGTQEIPGASTSFPITNPVLSPKTNILMTEMKNFDATIAKVGLDDIFFTFLIDGIETFYNGSVWTPSSGYPEVNTFAEIQANLSSLDLSDGKNITPNCYHHSEDGSTTPELLEINLSYDNFVSGIITPNQCFVFGYIYDENNDPVEGATIKIQLKSSIDAYDGESIIIFSDKILTSNSSGYWGTFLAETTRMTRRYKVVISKDTLSRIYKDVPVPDLVSVNFSELVNP
jgi:hypothetical protein